MIRPTAVFSAAAGAQFHVRRSGEPRVAAGRLLWSPIKPFGGLLSSGLFNAAAWLVTGSGHASTFHTCLHRPMTVGRFYLLEVKDDNTVK
jgi:hypothetical protein